jgi:hypothetical protein
MLEAIGRLAFETAQDRPLPIAVELRAHAARRRRRALEPPTGHRECAAAGKRRLTGHDLVGEQSERIDIGRRPHFAALELLGGHVAERADDLAGAGELGLGCGRRRRRRQPEVGDHDAPGAILLDQHHVRRLEISVHDADRVRRLEPRDDLLEDRPRLAELHPSAALETSREGLAVEQLHGQEAPLAVADEIVDAADVAVRDLLGEPDLVTETLQRRAARRALGGQQLDRHPAAELAVLGLVDLAHPPDAEQPHDLEALAEDCASGEVPGTVGRRAREQRRQLTHRRRSIEDRRAALVRGEQLFDLLSHLGVAAAQGLEQFRPPGRRAVDDPVEDLPDPAPAIARRARCAHSGSPSVGSPGLRAISRRSQARAAVHERFTLRGDWSRARAVSATLRPAKYRSLTTRARSRVAALEATERLVESEEIDQITARLLDLHRLDSPPVAAALARHLPPRVLDQDPAHRFRGNGEEVRPTLPLRRAPAEQSHVGFVDDGGRLQRVVRPFSRHERPGDSAQLFVNGSNSSSAAPSSPAEIAARMFVTSLPGFAIRRSPGIPKGADRVGTSAPVEPSIGAG